MLDESVVRTYTLAIVDFCGIRWNETTCFQHMRWLRDKRRVSFTVFLSPRACGCAREHRCCRHTLLTMSNSLFFFSLRLGGERRGRSSPPPTLLDRYLPWAKPSSSYPSRRHAQKFTYTIILGFASRTMVFCDAHHQTAA